MRRRVAGAYLSPRVGQRTAALSGSACFGGQLFPKLGFDSPRKSSGRCSQSFLVPSGAGGALVAWGARRADRAGGESEEGDGRRPQAQRSRGRALVMGSKLLVGTDGTLVLCSVAMWLQERGSGDGGGFGGTDGRTDRQTGPGRKCCRPTATGTPTTPRSLPRSSVSPPPPLAALWREVPGGWEALGTCMYLPRASLGRPDVSGRRYRPGPWESAETPRQRRTLHHSRVSVRTSNQTRGNPKPIRTRRYIPPRHLRSSSLTRHKPSGDEGMDVERLPFNEPRSC